MRILFFGTATFAVPCLERLLAQPGHEVIGVVTQPDRPQGRGGKVSMAPVKVAAVQHQLPTFQPEKVRAKEFVEEVQAMAPDVLVVAAFGQIIPQRMLNIPPFGGVNVHGSLLPRWRGAAPIQYSLMAGDAETGVTTMQMDAGLDTGDMLLTRALTLTDEDNYGTVEEKLSRIGADLLIETLARLKAGDCPRIPQDAALVTLAPALPPDTGRFDWSRGAEELHNLTRGVTPKPGAYTFFGGKRLKVLRTAMGDGGSASPGASESGGNALPGVIESNHGSSPGMIESIDRRGITVGTGKGTIRLINVQPESKSSMQADAWARGARLAVGQSFDLAPASEERQN
jgi:methionyl-tRNA formyltransferase